MGDISSTEKKLHWHLQGNWAPVEEELNESNLEVKGKIPEDLSGLYVRNGFNPVSGYSDTGSLEMECFMEFILKTVRHLTRIDMLKPPTMKKI